MLVVIVYVCNAQLELIVLLMALLAVVHVFHVLLVRTLQLLVLQAVTAVNYALMVIIQMLLEQHNAYNVLVAILLTI